MIGRKVEVQKIHRLLDSRKSEFLAVTGRRRVGKTYLVDTVLRAHYCFSMTGVQNGNMQAQLANFAIKLSEYDGSFQPQSPKNWQYAMLMLKRYLQTLDTSKKQVIFIDELPWVHTRRSQFIAFLAHLWNDYLSKEKHFLLVICGSATSWITQKVINDPGGLHNRVTEIIHLSPFKLSETKAFLQEKRLHFSDQELARIYMTLGGIPFYLESLQKGESFASAIERVCFSPAGLLRNEYHNLYQALFTHADIHQKIVETLSSKPYGIQKIQLQQASGLANSGSFQRALEELLISDFLVEQIPFGKRKRGSYLRLTDEYSVFYHRFIKQQKQYLPGIWQQLAASQPYKSWAGYAFESLCHKHITEIKTALGISAVYAEISSLYVPGSSDQEGFQVDLIIDRKDDAINLCEIKFHSKAYMINKLNYEQLVAKRERFIAYTETKKQVFLTFITNYGIIKNEYALEIVDAEVQLADLFS